MKKTLVWILVAANVSLAGTLAWRGIASNTASAQAAPRGKYIMIPGQNSSSSEVIYLFDSTNGRVGAMAPDPKNVLIKMQPIDLKPIFENAQNSLTPAVGNGRTTNNNANDRQNRPGQKAR